MPDETLNPGNLPMLMRRGIQFGKITVILKDPTGAVINLTGYTPRWIARPEVPSPNEYDFNPALTGTPVDGKVEIIRTDEETMRDWPAGTYNHALTLEDSSNDIFGPFITGTLTVEDQSARS
jgi:hypothetical protein